MESAPVRERFEEACSTICMALSRASANSFRFLALASCSRLLTAWARSTTVKGLVSTKEQAITGAYLPAAHARAQRRVASDDRTPPWQ
jgi:hypothetical protein